MVGAPTRVFVGIVLFAALIGMMYMLMGPLWATFCAVLLVFEAWTVADKVPGNTISEVVKRMSERTGFVTLIFGGAVVAMIAHGLIPANVKGLYIALAIGVLLGHWFVPMNGKGRT